MTEEYKSLPKRQDIPENLKWRVETVFASDQDWEAGVEQCQQKLEQTEKFRGTLGQSPERLLAYLEFQSQICQELDRLFLYAAMRQDEDNANPV